MITYTAPDFRAGEDVFLEKIRTDYIGTKLKENIKGTVKIYQGKPAILSVTAAAACEDGHVSVLTKKKDYCQCRYGAGSKKPPAHKGSDSKANGKAWRY